MTRLLDPELDGKGYVVVTDNYYTSERLATTLNNRGIGFVGTFNAGATSFSGFSRPELGTYASGAKQGDTRYGRAVEPGKYRTATRALATIAEENGASSSSTPPPATPSTRLSDHLYIATWSDSSKTNPVSLLANVAEAEHATCMRQPKVPTDANPECAKEERACPWIATIYNAYYGGVDTGDMDVKKPRTRSNF